MLKTNLDQAITPQKARLGPDNNSTTYIYLYIEIYAYMHAVRLGYGPIIAILKVRFWTNFVLDVFTKHGG